MGLTSSACFCWDSSGTRNPRMQDATAHAHTRMAHHEKWTFRSASVALHSETTHICVPYAGAATHNGAVSFGKQIAGTQGSYWWLRFALDLRYNPTQMITDYTSFCQLYSSRSEPSPFFLFRWTGVLHVRKLSLWKQWWQKAYRFLRI